MARPTPTYTPVRNYAIGFSLSLLLLFSDINYGTFAPLRGFLNASTLYAQMFARGIFENLSMTLTSIQKNKSLLEENKELRDQILQIRTKDFINRKNNENNIQIINFHKDLIRSLENDDLDIYKIASIDLRNYLCCSTHRIYLKNTNDIPLDSNLPVFAGGSFIGQTKGTYLNIIEVILFSDTSHVLPIKSNFFYCDAKGKGKPMLISCKLNQNSENFKNEIGDIIYTSGLGGIFLKDIEIGFISSINAFSINEVEVLITLKANPLEETFYGIMSKEADEI
jgi:cell shape-determining protein MreC